MAKVMGICGGSVGPKTENVDFSLVLPLLFEGHAKGRPQTHYFGGKDFGCFLGPSHETFDYKCFIAICKIVSPTQAGSTFSEIS